jgi:hypothetical protein
VPSLKQKFPKKFGVVTPAVTKNKQRNFRAGSQGWLALQLGITQQRVSELAQDPDWKWGNSSFTEKNVAEIRPWIASRRELNNATAGAYDEDPAPTGNEDALKALSRNPERVARIKLLIERTAKIKLDRELLSGGYIKKEEADKDKVRKVFSVRQKMQEIPMRASLIANQPEAECEKILSEWMREIADYFAGGGTE